jgi:hypothetical protein
MKLQPFLIGVAVGAAITMYAFLPIVLLIILPVLGVLYVGIRFIK